MSIDEKKSKGGRPPRAKGEKLQRVNLTLRPSLLFGLELLARAQHRSLSQAVEWAIQVGLNSFDVDNERTPLGALLDEVWAKESPERRILAIYERAPTILTFEERAICELLSKSYDLESLQRTATEKYLASDRSDSRVFDKQVEQMYWDVVLPHWEQLKELAVERANAGRPLQDFAVAVNLGFYDKAGSNRLPLWDIYEKEAALLAGAGA